MDLDTDEDISAQHLIDFSPIYRCLHIYSVLGSRDIFENYYRTQREKQARLVVQPSFGSVSLVSDSGQQPSKSYPRSDLWVTTFHHPQSVSIQGFQTYLRSVIGFFVQEDHILNTSNGLIDRSYVDNLWSTCMTKIISTFKIHIVRFSGNYQLQLVGKLRWCVIWTHLFCICSRIRVQMRIFCWDWSNWFCYSPPHWECVENHCYRIIFEYIPTLITCPSAPSKTTCVLFAELRILRRSNTPISTRIERSL